MLAIIRVVVVVICCILICLLGTLYSLIRFRNPNNTPTVAYWFGKLHPLFGLKLEQRFNPATPTTSAIYIGNHQNNYDMITISSMLRPNTVTIGKKSLALIPFFNLAYWATGNIFIDRNNRAKSHATMNKLGQEIKSQNISIFMFPEGTRSRGRGLLPFKTGAFYTAVEAGIPIVPIICSNLHNQVKLNRWHNGLVICEELNPIDTTAYTKDTVRELAQYCHDLMAQRLQLINAEAQAYGKSKA